MIGSPDSQSFRTGSAARFWCCWALCITIFLWPRINGHQPHRRGLTPAGPGQHHVPWRRSGGDQRRQLEPPGRAIVGWKMVAVNAVNRCKSLLLTPSRFVRRRSFWWYLYACICRNESSKGPARVVNLCTATGCNRFACRNSHSCWPEKHGNDCLRRQSIGDDAWSPNQWLVQQRNSRHPHQSPAKPPLSDQDAHGISGPCKGSFGACFLRR